MKNEIETINDNQSLQTELTIAKQKNEIMELKFKLQKVQAEKASRLEDSLFSPALYEHYQDIAATYSKSSIIPTIYRGKPEDIFIAMEMGYQLGFPLAQSLQDIAVINGRPCLWGDGLLSVCLKHPECQDIDEQPIYSGENIIGYTCTVVRKGHKPHTKQFTMTDAKAAGLWGNNVWKKYPSRMLQMRARSLALRDKFADALRGLKVDVDQEDNETFEGEFINTQDKTTTQTQNLKTILNVSTPQEEKNEDPKKEVKEKTSDEKITPEKVKEISTLLDEKMFTTERRQKACEYFKIEKLEELTMKQAEVFLVQINKASIEEVK